jgi:cytidylate kinase
MTTVVFPEAFLKIYLDASVEERTRRRTAELIAKEFAVDEERVRAEIIERDDRDSGRELAPLKKADDACYVDSTGLSKEEVLRRIIELVRGGKELKDRPKIVKSGLQ